LNIRGSFESTFEVVGVACFDGVMKVRILLHCKFSVYVQEQPYEAQGKDAASEKRRRTSSLWKEDCTPEQRKWGFLAQAVGSVAQ